MDTSQPDDGHIDSDSVGELLVALRSGGVDTEDARQQLYSVLYRDLRDVAGRLMQHERIDHTLQPTALVHEAFLRLARGDARLDISDRAHFLAVATRAMRQVLIDHARRHGARKRTPVDLTSEVWVGPAAMPEGEDPVLALDAGLRGLEALQPRVARVAEMRIIGGMTHDQIASVLKVTSRTVVGDWALARRWLRRRIERGW